jgi:hypothetical protein
MSYGQLVGCRRVLAHPGLLLKDWTRLGSAQPLPQLILGPLSNSTCLVKCLRGLVRAKVPAPNAPNAPIGLQWSTMRQPKRMLKHSVEKKNGV